MSEIASASGEDQGLVERIFEHVNTEDLTDRDPAYLGGAARSLIELVRSREQRIEVAVFTPSSDVHGWTSPRTIVQVCTDDSPFLVDSITEAIAALGYRVHLIVHPIMPAGVVMGEKDAEEKDAGNESWMHIEMTRLADEAAHERVRSTLHQVLTDVAKAVTDWQPMREVCLNIVEEIKGSPPPTVTQEEVARTTEFLTWLTHDQFTFLGYREYALTEANGELALAPVSGTGLGILTEETHRLSRLRPEAQATASEPRLLTITKANSRATVHRSAYLDYIGIRTFDDDGNVTGERRFLGLFTSSTYAASVTQLPIVATKVDEVIRRSGHSPLSHSGKFLHQILETYPRDELFQDSVENLTRIANEVGHLTERRRARMFIRADEFGRFVSVLVYMPRDRYSTAVRLKIEALLRKAYGAETIDFTTNISESPLAQVHLVLRMPRGEDLPKVDVAELQRDLNLAVRTWDDQLVNLLREAHGEHEASQLLADYAGAFTAGYQEAIPPASAVKDLDLLRSLGGPEDVRVRVDNNGTWRFRVASHVEFPLTEMMPVLTAFGVQVIDERPFPVVMTDGATRHISDFGLELGDGDNAGRFEEGFRAVWLGKAESDRLNSLIAHAGLTWQQVLILRALGRYAHQVNPSNAYSYTVAALVRNPILAAGIFDLFDLRFNPDRGEDGDERAAELLAKLEDVQSADDDRALRMLIGIVRATLRTNFYAGLRSGRLEPEHPGTFAVSMKIDCAAVPGMPKPHPMAEIWVYSPQVEGVHLRFSPVARGGLRWSDRREDFRTEVLGLVKAQMVKNAVIVPGGSKGGFVGKQLPLPTDRGAWIEAGKDAYRSFIRGLLDVTDNRDGADVVPPTDVVRHDGDDPYLVVAADKGTAAFSDTANEISREYGFWLDDAFASGGSAGYDHKGMGITARGAWESAKRHFRELGVDVQNTDFTVVGIGDMSGDVFGNGMLRSRHTRLIAAFDHRHVFIDPDPDPEASFTERERLYGLPTSSWADYNTELISAGGGVFERGAKMVPLTPEIRRALGLEEDVAELSPSELIRAALRAPVDLIYNGGIGTYIKASSQSHADIGDPAGDSVRVDARDLRARVIVEGGNLGVSQLGRIEAAKRGIAVNTDAIDNSAGVTTSDKEVNLKILFTDLIRTGALTLEERNALLAEMTDEVAAQVLTTNYEQNALLSNTLLTAGQMLPVHQRVIHWLEERGDLVRSLEDLPDDAELASRRAEGKGLTQPELAVVIAYSKLALKADLTGSGFADDEWYTRVLAEYFPAPLRERFPDALAAHPLRENLIVNDVANSLVNRGGMTFAFRAMDETGADFGSIARAYTASAETFRMNEYTGAVAAADSLVPAHVQSDLYMLFRRVLDRAVRYFLIYRPDYDLTETIEAMAPVLEDLRTQLPDVLVGAEAQLYAEKKQEYLDAGVEESLASWGAGLLPLVRMLDVIHIAQSYDADPRAVARLYFQAADMVGFAALMAKVRALPQADRWESLARASLREDLYAVLTDLVSVIVEQAEGDLAGVDLDAWFTSGGDVAERALESLRGALVVDEPNLAVLSVAVRKLRTVVDRRRNA